MKEIRFQFCCNDVDFVYLYVADDGNLYRLYLSEVDLSCYCYN